MDGAGGKFSDLWKIYEPLTLENAPLTTNDFRTVFISFLDDPDCESDVDEEMTAEAEKYFTAIENQRGYTISKSKKNFWLSKRRLLGKDVYQEYPALSNDSLKKVSTGYIYKDAYHSSLLKYPSNFSKEFINKSCPIQIAFDLGSKDATVMVFFQKINGVFYIYYTYSTGTQSKVVSFSSYLSDCERILDDMKFPRIGKIIVPHDISRKQANDETIIEYEGSREDVLNRWANEKASVFGCNVGVQILSQKETKPQDGINKVLENFKAGQIIILPETNEKLIEGILNYSWEYDRTIGRHLGTPKKRDKYNHVMDALRYAIVGASDWEASPPPPNSFTSFNKYNVTEYGKDEVEPVY